MTQSDRIEYLLEKMPQKLTAQQICKITKIPYKTVTNLLTDLARQERIERKMFYSSSSGHVCWHYWKRRGRP